eukprot:TRINITY_DN21079_c0_g2_i6.p2 TRINITY_DN21079_c0_g2~~TRINITY_DN21079_c0_g2_i6.p2  ORF type:complete len:235 (+),score=-10.10 TRINITY_DN21079_c0_g2_i6:83-706(+)
MQITNFHQIELDFVQNNIFIVAHFMETLTFNKIPLLVAICWCQNDGDVGDKIFYNIFRICLTDFSIIYIISHTTIKFFFTIFFCLYYFLHHEIRIFFLTILQLFCINIYNMFTLNQTCLLILLFFLVAILFQKNQMLRTAHINQFQPNMQIFINLQIVIFLFFDLCLVEIKFKNLLQKKKNRKKKDMIKIYKIAWQFYHAIFLILVN